MEDALGLSGPAERKPGAKMRIAVPILPHISNFDDLDPLDMEPDVELIRVRPGETIPADCRIDPAVRLEIHYRRPCRAEECWPGH